MCITVREEAEASAELARYPTVITYCIKTPSSYARGELSDEQNLTVEFKSCNCPSDHPQRREFSSYDTILCLLAFFCYLGRAYTSLKEAAWRDLNDETVP